MLAVLRLLLELRLALLPELRVAGAVLFLLALAERFTVGALDLVLLWAWALGCALVAGLGSAFCCTLGCAAGAALGAEAAGLSTRFPD